MTPVEKYRAFIKELAEGAKNSCNINLIRKGTFENNKFSFVKELTSVQREQLAALLKDERESAFHYLLALLTWYVDCDGFALTVDGEVVNYEKHGGGEFHYDYVTMRDNEDWYKGR
ncbi:MAG: hypothetical protein LBT46_01235 [Planctomycetaceae bacterium]|jgi:hypothetical protein|nr:hypothetical protein [Planctomycetaceae bacterium]